MGLHETKYCWGDYSKNKYFCGPMLKQSDVVILYYNQVGFSPGVVRIAETDISYDKKTWNIKAPEKGEGGGRRRLCIPA